MGAHSSIQKLRSGLDLKGGWQLLKASYKAWMAQDPFRQSATIAYYAIFSLPALLVIIISLAGFFFGPEAVTGQLSRNINRIMGSETAKQIESMIAEASINDKSALATMIAVGVMFIGSTAVFVQLQKTFNIIWQVKPRIKGKFLLVLKARLLSFGLVLTIGFLLLISLVITSLVALFGAWLETRIPGLAVMMLQILNFVISFGLITVLFAMMFKFLPDASIKWRNVWTGAVLTSLLFSLGQMALGLYFGKATPASTYGAAGSVVLIMLWMSYSCMILFFGAEFTRQYTLARERKIVPAEHAMKEKRDDNKRVETQDVPPKKT